MTEDRAELIQFIYDSITKGSDPTFSEIGTAMVEGVLSKVKDNKFLSASLDPIFKEFSRTDLSPKVQSGMANIVQEVMKLVIDKVVMED